VELASKDFREHVAECRRIEFYRRNYCVIEETEQFEMGRYCQVLDGERGERVKVIRGTLHMQHPQFHAFAIIFLGKSPRNLISCAS